MPLPRRTARAAAGAAIGIAAVAAGGLLATGTAMGSDDDALVATADATVPIVLTRGKPLVEPPVVRSENGRLKLTLSAKVSRTQIAGGTAISNVWNGLFPAPTLEIDPGDRLEIDMKNDGQFGEATNLHTHGAHVSPKNPGDNVFLSIPTGGEHSYRYDFPEDHVPGMLWYHPHRHPLVQSQVFAGQAGALIVRGGLDDLPGVGDVRDRTLVYQVTQFENGPRPIRQPSSSTPAKQLQLVNGQLNPTIDIRPGETQRWRILNASSDKFLVLRLQGHSMFVIADDGNPRAETQKVTTQFIGPGERREFLVRARSRPGRFALQSMFFVPVRAQPSYSAPTRTIATMVIKGPQATRRPVPTKLLPVEDLRTERVDRRRRIVFSESRTSPRFFVNGKEFSATRIDQTMRLGDLEEWTIVNTTDEWHTFHIHINPYQVTKVNGKPVRGITYDDNVVVGPNGGTVTMRTRFKDFTGKFVFHCHVLFHEDNGMMSTVQVVPR
ncbi:MAG: multicopper oxidase family protein [Thermoleophilia bacterium]|jgi:FtsP/CotA-like multicopper oxidase with cupredoxin domain|nr:multicopper oxidase family protein [Thermoleophilia bacterium]